LLNFTGLGIEKKRKRKEKKRKDYAFRRQLNEKPGIIPGCPEGLGIYWRSPLA